jgi:GT2 family glycosyltransferase
MSLVTFADADSAHVEAASLPISFIQMGWNGGWAAGNNAGIRFALSCGCDAVWLLNNDTEVEPDALTWLLERVRQDVGIGLCGSTLVYHGRRETIQALGGARWRPWRGWGMAIGAGQTRADGIDAEWVEAQLGYVNGASMLATRRFIEDVGFIEESYFLYWEEIDWEFRGLGRYKLGYAPRSVVYHKVGASIGTRDSGQQSLLADFYMTRGRMLFSLRHGWRSIPITLVETGIAAARSLSQGDAHRAWQLLRALLGGHHPRDRFRTPARHQGDSAA